MKSVCTTEPAHFHVQVNSYPCKLKQRRLNINILGFDLRESLKRKSSMKCDITYTLGFSPGARSVTVQYYDLIISACFVKAMEERRERANSCVCQNLCVFSIITSSQRNPRLTLDCNSSPTQYAQMLWPKLIFYLYFAHSSTSVSH